MTTGSFGHKTLRDMPLGGGKNSKTHAHLIQIGDTIKPMSRDRYMVVEAVADHAGDYPRRVFLLEDGSTFDTLAASYIWFKRAAFAE